MHELKKWMTLFDSSDDVHVVFDEREMFPMLLVILDGDGYNKKIKFTFGHLKKVDVWGTPGVIWRRN